MEGSVWKVAQSTFFTWEKNLFGAVLQDRGEERTASRRRVICNVRVCLCLRAHTCKGCVEHFGRFYRLPIEGWGNILLSVATCRAFPLAPSYKILSRISTALSTHGLHVAFNRSCSWKKARPSWVVRSQPFSNRRQMKEPRFSENRSISCLVLG